jgi:hypothetical protein
MAMKKLILVMVVAAAAVACGDTSSEKAKPDTAAPETAPPSAGVSPPKEKKTWIYFTKNHDKGTGSGQYNVDCVGIVGTETIGTKKGDKVTWQIRQTNGGNDDDKCEDLDLETVNLRFATHVMGASVMKKLTANPGGVIQGNVSTATGDIGSIVAHKYQVFIGDTPAGPDPVIIVDCATCGPPPE